MIELRWTTKKYGLVLQYRTWDMTQGRFGKVEREAPAWTEWTDVADTEGDYPRIEYITPLEDPMPMQIPTIGGDPIASLK